MKSKDTLRTFFSKIIPALVVFILPVSVIAQVNGEYRSAATGIWATAATWETYSASSSSWSAASAAPSGAAAVVTVRNGHTVTLNGNVSFKKLTIDAGGSVISADNSERRLDFMADTSFLVNNGNLGGALGSNSERIIIANTPTCTLSTISGTGTTSVSRIRFNTSSSSVTLNSTLVIDHNMTITTNGITAWYNNTSNTNAENATITINAGKTVVMAGGFHSSSATVPANPGGSYTYNIRGTLDMVTTGTVSNLLPQINSASTVTVNVSGTWKIGNLNASYPTTSNLGNVVLNIQNGGLVDASRASTFTLGNKYFIVSGNGKLKRTVTAAASPVTFAVGTSATAYNPAIITATSTDDTVAVNVNNTLTYTMSNPSKIVTKQWQITPSGTGAGLNATFGWATADQAGGFVQASPVSVFTYNTVSSQWTPASAASAITGSGTVAAPYTTGFATAPANLSGLYVVGNNDAVVVVIPTVSITAAPGNTACAGTSVTFTAATTNITGAHYQWKVNGGNVGTDANTYTTTTLTNGNQVTCEISYTAGGAAAATSNTITMTINPQPNAGAISGSGSVCSGTTEQLTNTVTGGTWSSSNTAFATVSSTGLVSGVAVGSVTITYTATNSCGTATATKAMAVTLGASAGTLSGASAVCPAATTTLTSTASGGAWSSSNTAVATVSATGVVTGVSAGTATIAYVVVNGCGRDSAKRVMTVNPAASAGTISGTTTVCIGATSALSSTVSGGTWSSGTPARATVSSAGVVTGVTAGSVVITYSVTNTCGTAAATYNMTVSTVPTVASISGPSSVCVGATITLTDSAAGGAWSNTNSGVLTVSSAGVVTGVGTGSDVVSYTVSNACGSAAATKTITVSGLPAAGTVSGVDSVCVGDNITLQSSTNGLWSSATGKTIISNDGIVTGLSVGLDTVVFSVVNQCGATQTKHPIVVWQCNPTRVGSVSGNVSALVYPNPNNGTFICKIASHYKEDVKVVITNMLGAVVETRTAKTNEGITIQLKQAAGVYFVTAITEHGRTAVKVNITE